MTIRSKLSSTGTPHCLVPRRSAIQRPAPNGLNWMAAWNSGKPVEAQIRPFGFLLSFMTRHGMFGPFSATVLEKAESGRPPQRGKVAPIAPYDRDPARALPKVFDRVTGKPVRPEQLKTYAEALAQFRLSSEDKFENGQFLDRGRTARRHAVATRFVWIGKEANQVGESGEADPIWSAVEEFTAT